MGKLIITAKENGMLCVDADMVDCVTVNGDPDNEVQVHDYADELCKVRVYMRNDPGNPMYTWCTFKEAKKFVKELTIAKGEK